MYLRVCCLFISILSPISVGLTSLLAKDPENYYSIYYKLVIPSDVVAESIVIEAEEEDKVSSFHGFGVSYNGVRMDFSEYFEGYRITLNYDFMYRSPVNPFIGASIVFGTDRERRLLLGSTRELDNNDFVVGFALNIYNIVKPNISYAIRAHTFQYGVRIHIPIFW